MPLPLLDELLVHRMARGVSGAPSREALQAWQLERLRETVRHAREWSPFYVRHLDGVDDSNLCTVDDFSRLPFLNASVLREKPEQLLCVSQDEIARVVTLTSSGTTGQPKRIFYTEDDLEATREFFHRGFLNIVGSGETVLILMPGDRPDSVGRLLVDALGRGGIPAVAHGIMDDAVAALHHCREVDAQCVVGPASHVNAMACASEALGLKLEIRSVLLCWDAVPDAVVANVERIWGCRVFRHWGMIETGLGGAVECAPGSGMHLRESDIYLEIIHPQSGELLPDGESGEMVVTTLLRRGMPLIRYRTGDMGCILPGKCSCGSPLRRLDANVCRNSGGIEVGEASFGLTDLNEKLFSVTGLADFSAKLKSGTLHITACGHGDDLLERVHAALGALEGIDLNLEIQINPGFGPIGKGLGKRQIGIEQEN